ncbi:hypothetical protein Raf01_93980 [Rugosimonospora africana]|uniref:Uncharacterized protein n=1 Tax=Rugosimonospora africana TaxID=556532 RepID=A0A8J3R2T7_9ACTN|nr:hypothetical protein Raf01_93980 [Rugosimonospora africana]
MPDQCGLDQRLLGREVPEHGGDANAGQSRDLLGGAGLAVRAEDVVSRGEYALAVLLSVSAHADTVTEAQTPVL